MHSNNSNTNNKSIQKEQVFFSQKDGHTLNLIPCGSWDKKVMDAPCR